VPDWLPNLESSHEERHSSIQSPVVPTTMTNPFYAPLGLQQNHVPINDRSSSAAPFPPELAFPTTATTTLLVQRPQPPVSPRTAVAESSAPAQFAVSSAATALGCPTAAAVVVVPNGNYSRGSRFTSIAATSRRGGFSNHRLDAAVQALTMNKHTKE
jgi:hypothetical protein